MEPQAQPQKHRHGCLTAYLIVAIIANSVLAFLYTAGKAELAAKMPNLPEWAFWALATMGVFNVICAVALFSWKKWGFYGFVVSAVITLVINLSIGVSPVHALLGLIGIAVLYGVLQIGETNKGWPQLD